MLANAGSLVRMRIVSTDTVPPRPSVPTTPSTMAELNPKDPTSAPLSVTETAAPFITRLST